jgi:uncharacterized protein YkwD
MHRALWPTLLAAFAVAACGRDDDAGCKRTAVGSSSYACGESQTPAGGSAQAQGDAKRAPTTARRPGLDAETTSANGGAKADAAEATPRTCYETDDEACALQLAMADELNAFREDNGLPPLRYSAELSYAAFRWSGEQAERAEISHDGFPTQRQAVLDDTFPALARVFVAGENVARGMPGSSNPAAVARYLTTMWANSPGHRANMLNDEFELAGLGAVVSDGQVFATQIFGRR